MVEGEKNAIRKERMRMDAQAACIKTNGGEKKNPFAKEGEKRWEKRGDDQQQRERKRGTQTEK